MVTKVRRIFSALFLSGWKSESKASQFYLLRCETGEMREKKFNLRRSSSAPLKIINIDQGRAEM